MTQSKPSDTPLNWFAPAKLFNAALTGGATLTRYNNVLLIPFLISINYFSREECQRIWKRTPFENFLAYMKLGQMNIDLSSRALTGALRAFEDFFKKEVQAGLPALAKGDPAVWAAFSERMQQLATGAAETYPKAIDAIASEFGFHFERQPAKSKVAETQRFILYQVMPSKDSIKVRMDAKPVLIMPPFVLGHNILAFLPADERSYAHAFANQGIPTYIRVLKDIRTLEAVQVMTLEDDARDTRTFCEKIKARHQAPVTLNGYCQGGYAALCDLLSGELDGLADAFITCVAPMDGTRSTGLAQFLSGLPPEFNNLAYGTKVLPNGNQVADGTLMGWIYKLKSIEMEAPVLAMWRDMALASAAKGDPQAINKTAAALNYWLLNERNDLPMDITRTSFKAYTTPITADGDLPVRLFGRKLNLKRIKEKNIPWLICYGTSDDLVEKATALAPLDFVAAEVTPFPKGHVAIATSWSSPKSDYALHTRFDNGTCRGPVRFHLDLDDARQK